tara:strand:- start:376 stop:1185 length:810 start_codon:yes stop_codon:yes gene_type:complete
MFIYKTFLDDRMVYDILGNVVVVKFDSEVRSAVKKKWASQFLKKHKSVRTVLEKSGKFSGRLRTLKTKHIAGEKTKEVLYKENGCLFRFNVDTCYFSSRLSTEREEIASAVKKGEKVLVMFSGIGVYGIVIGKNSKADEVSCVELSRACNKYAEENVKRNKLSGKVKIVGGDVRKKVPLLKQKFERIVMARPNLSDSFLDVAFKVIKKGGVIHYYGFYHEIEATAGVLVDLIEKEAQKAKKKVKILKVKKAGEIAPYRYRWRVDLKIIS